MNVGLIPVRGGSKSIPLKTIKEIAGKPLIYYSLKAACLSKCLDKVYVCTDSEEIRETVLNIIEKDEMFAKAEVIGRSPATATDTATSLSAIIEFAEKYEFETLAFIQATSPLLTGEELDQGFKVFFESNADSVLSVVPQKRFIWKKNEKNFAEPQNYDFRARPRRQDFSEYYVENGAFYITKRKTLLKEGNYLSGNIKMVPMNELTYFEIDEPSDWLIIEELLRKREEAKGRQRKSKKNKIKLFLSDSDGCLTDGGMYYAEDGTELKKYNAKDGMGFRLLKEKGIMTGIITGEDLQLIKNRAKKLNMDFCITGCQNKLDAVKKICTDMGIGLEDIAYIGDDLNDLELLSAVGLSASPKNAVNAVKDKVCYVCEKQGGEGAVREFIDFILKDSLKNN